MSPKPQPASSNWHRAKAARAEAIASSLFRGRSTMVGWNPSELITPLVPPSSHRLSRSPSCGQGRPCGSKLDAHETFLLALVDEADDITLAEMQVRLRAERSVSVGLGTLWRFFDRRCILRALSGTVREASMGQGALATLTGVILPAASSALATTTAPGAAPGATSGASGGGIGDYWWVIVILLVIAAAIWYFMKGRGRV